MRRAEASGSSGSTISCPGAEALEASTPALAHTKPWRVRQTSTPRSARSTSADWSSTTCTCARIARRWPRRFGRQLARALAGAAPRPATTVAPSALETAVCAIATSCPSCSCSRPASAPAISAARSSPARTSGMPPRARAPMRATSRAAQAGVPRERGSPRSRWPSTARVRARPRAVAREALAQDRQVRARVDVEQQRGHLLHAARGAGSARERAVACAAVGPEARRDRVGRARAAGRWCRVPWRSGTITTSPRALRTGRGDAEQRLQLVRVQRGAVAGDAQHALDARRQRVPHADRRRRRLAALGRVAEHHRPELACAARATARSRVTTIVSSIAAVRASALQHVGRPSRAPAARRSESATLAPSRCLA